MAFVKHAIIDIGSDQIYMKKFFHEFASFIRRGNVLDLAVGIIIGGAFQSIVKSLVNDIIMPVIGGLSGTSVKDAKMILVPEVKNAGGTVIRQAVILNYGAFIQAIIDFLIISFTVFVIIKTVLRLENAARHRLGKAKDAPEPIKPTAEELLTDIRDILQSERNQKNSG